MAEDPPFFEKMTVVGVGLIGGSLSLGLKEAGAVGRVVGVGRGLANLETARARGIVDDFTHDPVEAARGADLVFLATPVLSIVPLVEKIRRAGVLKEGAILTDGGSVKGALVEPIEKLLPPLAHFVGSHPVAGSEKTGAAAARTDLFRGRKCVLTPTGRTDPTALSRVERMWRTVGMEVVVMDPVSHDRALAVISHLPHLAAYALVEAAAGFRDTDPRPLDLAAGGFRDITRIASSSPEVWREICLTNREAILESITLYENSLARLKGLVEAGDGAGLRESFAEAKAVRDAIT